MTELFKTSLDLSSFVWCELTGLFKTSLDLSSICLTISPCYEIVKYELTGFFNSYKSKGKKGKEGK